MFRPLTRLALVFASATHRTIARVAFVASLLRRCRIGGAALGLLAAATVVSAEPRDIRFRGRVTYVRPDGLVVGADTARFEIRDRDDNDPFGDELIIEDYTESDGSFDVTAYWEDDDNPDVYIYVESENEVVNGAELHVDGLRSYDFSTEDRVYVGFPGNDFDFQVELGGDIQPSDWETRAAFHIMTSVTRTKRWLDQHAPMFDLSEKTSYDYPTVLDLGGLLEIAPFSLVPEPCGFTALPIGSNRDWGWDTTTIIHEYFHYLMYANSSYYESPLNPPYCDPNGYGDQLPLAIPLCPALTELFGPWALFVCLLCGDPHVGCGHSAWCHENEIVAWQEGVPNWLGDVAFRHLLNEYPGEYDPNPASNGWEHAQDYETNVAPCAVDLSFGHPRRTEGFVAALLTDMDDPVEPQPPGSCAYDAMGLGDAGEIWKIFRVLRDDQPTTVAQFIEMFVARFPEEKGGMWRTANAIGGDQYVWPDTQPPGAVTGLISPTHPSAGGGTLPVIRVTWPEAPMTHRARTCMTWAGPPLHSGSPSSPS